MIRIDRGVLCSRSYTSFQLGVAGQIVALFKPMVDADVENSPVLGPIFGKPCF